MYVRTQLYLFDGYVDQGGTLEPFHVEITPPKRSPLGPNEYYCVVTAPYFFEPPTRLIGEGPEQAQELAFRFINRFIDDIRLLDHRKQVCKALRP